MVEIGAKKVLVVEDDRFLSALLERRLVKEGFHVLLAEDGDRALEIMRLEKPHLTILDIILPKKSGFEVMGLVQQEPSLQTGPIVVMTNLGQEDDVARGKSLGALEYFIKAKTSIEEIVQKVKAIVGGM
ncbi:MAG: hypothetical protein A3H06_00075 [Candidatus Colwellbacteria bacterium RIFCSPLOWO2_12_FULL_44_13]|uniref:Response regulatory domain-containing protein n=3 Tax=Candidatus Colwelliibacteriota TaxID=1817904 RepID=A0A1G1Z4R4_9BACT|nr:MAG: hypothetical protein A3I31_03180 [Candidatus Colwellbacteria bacterium RIFCSPLOWO2_02_FULL_44_20b]OGY59811.1 MAG: hypothetical protein A3F24_02800 [Candidatus Colwellbacteria bacterium RIFCSPHIGHO2_12_FULL_44_17]OGY61854.1 MAG: hypothetical protein A3H06_00075 [Candidatus Colwellbacteria bacterium RIFCSPLOWO2_12_FULL_44_13]